MKLDIEAIHHVGLVVKDREIAEGFYVHVLGLERVPGRPAWLKLNATNAIHLIPLGTGEPEHPHHRYRHLALQVAELRPVRIADDTRMFRALETNPEVLAAIARIEARIPELENAHPNEDGNRIVADVQRTALYVTAFGRQFYEACEYRPEHAR